MHSLLSKQSSSEANSCQALFLLTEHRRDLVSALNGLMPLCRTIPGVRLALDIREGQVVLALN